MLSINKKNLIFILLTFLTIFLILGTLMVLSMKNNQSGNEFIFNQDGEKVYTNTIVGKDEELKIKKSLKESKLNMLPYIYADDLSIEDVSFSVVFSKQTEKLNVLKNTDSFVHSVYFDYKVEEKIKKQKSNQSNGNILFIGNSLIEGLRLTSKDSNRFLCKVGISLEGLKSNIYGKIPNNICDKVVIGMGSNELGSYSEEKFKQSYKDLINKIYEVNENAVIYCLSVPPVSQNKSNSSAYFNNTNVKIYSQYIKDICDEVGLIYIDNSLFFGEVLESSKTGDGMHLTGKVYKEWYNWIIEQL